MDEKRDWQEVEKQLVESQNKIKLLQKKDEAWQQKDKQRLQVIEMLKEQLQDALSPNRIKTIEHSAEFWSNIRNGLSKKTGPFGSDAIKAMIKAGKMTVHDTDRGGQTLLILAASYGSYDLAQFLINNVYTFVLLQEAE